MNSWIYFIYVIALFSLSLIYFRIARDYEIVDTPNHRTMHEGSTIRGGGIIIFFGTLIFSFFVDVPGYYFIAGLAILGIAGFLDDLSNLSLAIRFPIQLLSILLILADLNLFSMNIFILVFVVIISTGILNAYNFMDGINGMTGGYSLVALISLVYVNNSIIGFISNEFLLFIILAVLVFNFFNFRNRAVCFAGDVGSFSIAFVIVYLLIKLISESQQLGYILFLALYGIDTIFTIVQRLLKKENIFEAHRLHLFQVVVSKSRMPHIYMSIIYMVVQVIINFIVISLLQMSVVQQLSYIGIMLILLALTYIGIKKKFMPDTI